MNIISIRTFDDFTHWADDVPATWEISCISDANCAWSRPEADAKPAARTVRSETRRMAAVLEVVRAQPGHLGVLPDQFGINLLFNFWKKEGNSEAHIHEEVP